ANDGAKTTPRPCVAFCRRFAISYVGQGADMQGTLNGRVQPHNARAAAIWSSGGGDYDEVSRGIADAIEHCVLRLDPQPGERILDLSTGTGWASRLVARRGATVVG